MIVKRTQTALMIAACLFLALNGCKSEVLTRDVPVQVRIPVAAPCVTGWPQKPPPLPLEGHWAGFDVRQKAAALGRYAIEWTNYAEALRAATAACPEVK